MLAVSLFHADGAFAIFYTSAGNKLTWVGTRAVFSIVLSVTVTLTANLVLAFTLSDASAASKVTAARHGVVFIVPPPNPCRHECIGLCVLGPHSPALNLLIGCHCHRGLVARES